MSYGSGIGVLSLLLFILVARHKRLYTRNTPVTEDQSIFPLCVGFHFGGALHQTHIRDFSPRWPDPRAVPRNMPATGSSGWFSFLISAGDFFILFMEQAEYLYLSVSTHVRLLWRIFLLLFLTGLRIAKLNSIGMQQKNTLVAVVGTIPVY